MRTLQDPGFGFALVAVANGLATSFQPGLVDPAATPGFAHTSAVTAVLQ